AYGRRQRALETEAIELERLEAVVGQVELALFVLAELVDVLILDLRIVHLPGHVAGMDVEPVNAPLAPIGLRDGSVEDAHGAGRDAGHAADIAADAIAAHEADDRVIGDLPGAVGLDRDASALSGGREFIVGRRRHERVPGCGIRCGTLGRRWMVIAADVFPAVKGPVALAFGVFLRFAVSRHVLSSTCARCSARTRLPTRRSRPAMFIRQPASVATTASAPVFSINATLSQTIAPLMPGKRTENDPPKPQHSSALSSGTSSRPRTRRSSRSGSVSSPRPRR